ncbi:histidine kinase [Emticicia sp. 17c]|uniref:histidine kinase n=1 Tax=Emticicia sp. 17c TaxID=3127704 RepID=UPI00301CD269
MKKAIIIIILLSFCLPLSAQTIIDIDSSFYRQHQLNLQHQTLFRLDSTHALPIEQISNSGFRPFHELPTFDRFSRYATDVWLKFQLKNTSFRDTLSALFTAGGSYFTTLYVFDGQKMLSVAEASKLLPDNQRPFRFDGAYIPVSIPPQKIYTYYARINRFSLKNIIISPAIVSYEQEAQTKEQLLYNDRFALVFNYSFIAILLFLGVFTFVQYWLNRQPYILYYSLYLFSMAAFGIWGFEYSPYVSYFMKYCPFLLISLRQNFYVLLTQYCYFLFIGNFLLYTHSHPLITQTIRFLLRSIVVLIMIELGITLALGRYDWEVYLSIFTQVYLSVFGCVVLFFLYQIKTRLAFYIKIGSSFLLLGGIFGFLSSWLHWVPQSSALLEHYPNAFFNTCILLEILFFSMGLAYKSVEIINQKNNLEQAVSLSELNMLRLQINPHFLFNSLNSIKSYIVKNKTEEAAEYLTDFSMLIRSILQKSKEQVVTLQEELDTALLYTKLEQVRFQKKFDIVVELSPSIDTQAVMVPALILQPYIENAIKHGLANKPTKGTLSLLVIDSGEEIEIKIDDDGIGRKQAAELKYNSEGHRSMGLAINEERLILLNKIHNWHIRCHIVDKFDAENKPLGTTIILTLPK